MKPYVHRSFWSDPDIEKQSSDIKLAALWLITNSQTSILGLCCASERRFEFETGLPGSVLHKVCQALPRAFKPFGDVIFITNFIRHQFGAGEPLMRNNYFRSLVSAFLGQIADIQDEIVRQYPEFTEARKGFKGLQSPRKGTVRKGKEDSSPEFEKFWAAYPKKKAKLKALQAWNKLSPPIEQCLAAIASLRKSHDWQKESGQFIPHPATWLNSGGWDDAPKIDLGGQQGGKASQSAADPEGWKEWRDKFWPDASKTVPYSQISREIQKEFEAHQKRNQ